MVWFWLSSLTLCDLNFGLSPTSLVRWNVVLTQVTSVFLDILTFLRILLKALLVVRELMPQ